MLGPEGHVYDPLPTPASIRIILLAPGEADEDVCCFLSPCDLDKDRAVNPSMPRPFESMCIGTAPAANTSSEKQFMLPLDSYIDDGEEQRFTRPDVSTEVAPKKRSRLARLFKNSASGTSSKPEARAQGRQDRDASNSEGKGEKKDEPSDDEWDILQLAKLTLAKGTLDSRVRRHPFQRFSALSYVWGSVEDTAPITIDQTRFWVTKNLFQALKAMRRRDQALPLWIDAICINQTDLEEKRVQIGLMRRIYRQAQKVTAYVPQTLEDTVSFNKLVREILRAEAECKKVLDSGDIPEQEVPYDDESEDVHKTKEQLAGTAKLPNELKSIGRVVPMKPTGTCIEDFDIPSEDDAAWGAWRRFFASPYFRRIWILQEYALGSNLYFRFGQGEGPADVVLLVMHAVNSRSRLMNAHYLGRGENSELSRAALLGWMGLEEMTHQRVFTRQDVYGKNDVRSQLIDKLDKALLYDATDPRDKLFALLGLVSDANEFMDLVSYQPADTYRDIYRRFTRRLIEKGHLVDVLRITCKAGMCSELPSWVPNFAAATADTFVGTVTRDRGFQAGGEARLVEACFPPYDKSQLIVSGNTFSTITFKTSAFVPHSPNSPITTGTGRLQDLFETFLTVFHELDAQLTQDLPATMMDVFHVVTMQQRNIDSCNPGNDTSKAIYDDLLLWRTVMVRIMNYQYIEGRSENKVVFGAMPENDRDFLMRIMGSVAGRCFCIVEVGTEKRVGLVPERALVGDSLAIVSGAPVPFVLREAENIVSGTRQTYRLVGDAYITGVMMGELAQELKTVMKEIVLV